MSDKLEQFQIFFVMRNARQRGPTSSDVWNDSMQELANDLASINTQWNQRLVPLLTTLPSGTEGNSNNIVDAWLNGLQGSTLFVDAEASSTSNSNYFYTAANRPNTVLEQFQALYTSLTSTKEELETLFNSSSVTAIQVPITDSGAYYVATNVESALEEVMIRVDSLVANQLDPSNISEPVGIGGVSHSAAQLTVTSTTKGFLPPRMTTAERNAIVGPTAGLLIWNTSTGLLNVHNGTNWYSLDMTLA